MQANKIVNAGNVAVPAILVLEKLGFDVSVKDDVQSGGFVAARPGEMYVADDPVALLGLVKIVELRGWDWRANDDQIDRVLETYKLS